MADLYPIDISCSKVVHCNHIFRIMVFDLQQIFDFFRYVSEAFFHLIKNIVTIIGGIISLIVFGEWSLALMKRLFKEGKSSVKRESDTEIHDR